MTVMCVACDHPLLDHEDGICRAIDIPALGIHDCPCGEEDQS